MENEKTVVYTKTKRYDGGKRLYEFEEIAERIYENLKGTLQTCTTLTMLSQHWED
ncbi:MAG: hypothetical protein ACLU3I_06735 [Acutalibacteraceae bacterium]